MAKPQRTVTDDDIQQMTALLDWFKSQDIGSQAAVMAMVRTIAVQIIASSGDEGDIESFIGEVVLNLAMYTLEGYARKRESRKKQ